MVLQHFRTLRLQFCFLTTPRYLPWEELGNGDLQPLAHA
jgi:hypothetical protein